MPHMCYLIWDKHAETQVMPISLGCIAQLLTLSSSMRPNILMNLVIAKASHR